MTGYELPTSLNIFGSEYAIRTDFRDIINVLIAMNDPDLDMQSKVYVLLKIIFINFEEIRPEHMEEAYKAACEFIDCGQKVDNKSTNRLIDWEQDARIIIPAVNGVAHGEIRSLPYLHWWTFFGYFMEIRESLFSSVLNIRLKKAKHKKLEKWEKDFYRENKDIIDFKNRDSEEIRAEKENLLNWL